MIHSNEQIHVKIKALNITLLKAKILAQKNPELVYIIESSIELAKEVEMELTSRLNENKGN
jgi:hypothetical protein